METNFKPNYAIHPGVILKEDLKAIKMSQKELSAITNIHSTIINEIIKGKRNFNADNGIKISIALNFPDDYYFGMQNFYDLTLARLKKEKEDNLIKPKNNIIQIYFTQDSNLVYENIITTYSCSAYIFKDKDNQILKVPA